MIKNAYAAAGVPMLPVVRGDRETARQIVLYSVAMVAFTVVVGLWLGPLYTVAAVVLGGGVRRARRAASARSLTRSREAPLPLLAPLPRAALHRRGARPGAPVTDQELARRNLRFGWALFLLFWLLFPGTFVVAVLYLQLD